VSKRQQQRRPRVRHLVIIACANHLLVEGCITATKQSDLRGIRHRHPRCRFALLDLCLDAVKEAIPSKALTARVSAENSLACNNALFSSCGSLRQTCKRANFSSVQHAASRSVVYYSIAVCTDSTATATSAEQKLLPEKKRRIESKELRTVLADNQTTCHGTRRTERLSSP